jgi:uncharacterized membrane protein
MSNSRWLPIALLVSLAINVLVAGFVIGRGMPFGERAGMHRTGGERLDPTAGYFRMLHKWPENRRESFRPVVREHMKGIRSHFQKIPPLHREIQASLNAEPFDSQALEAALEKLRMHLQISQEKTHSSLVELAKTMPLDERQRLGKEMRQPPRGFNRRRDH